MDICTKLDNKLNGMFCCKVKFSLQIILFEISSVLYYNLYLSYHLFSIMNFVFQVSE